MEQEGINMEDFLIEMECPVCKENHNDLVKKKIIHDAWFMRDKHKFKVVKIDNKIICPRCHYTETIKE